VRVQLTSPNYFSSFVSQKDLFEYNNDLIQQGDPEHFDKYYLSEDDEDIDQDLELEEHVEEALIFEQSNENSLKCRDYSGLINQKFLDNYLHL
jgi:hypothetical protein